MAIISSYLSDVFSSASNMTKKKALHSKLRHYKAKNIEARLTRIVIHKKQRHNR